MQCKLIIVDDEKKTRLFLKEILLNMDLNCEIAGDFQNGEQAWDYIQQHDVDIVITDIKMPKMDGLQFSERVYASGHKCKIIIVSGYSDFQYAQQAMRYGVTSYLLKPVDLDELQEVIGRLIDEITESVDVNLFEKIERYESFFLDAMSGIFEKKDLENEMRRLEFEPDSYFAPGCIVEFDMPPELYGKWKHGKGMVYVALYNAISFLFKNNAYPVFHRDTKYYFCILGKEAVDTAALKAMLLQVFDTDVKLEIVQRFDNVFEIKPNMFDANDVIKMMVFYHLSGERESVQKLMRTIADKSGLTRDSINKIDYFMKEYASQEMESVSDNRIRKANTYIEQNYAYDITRDDVAGALYMHPSYFSKYYKEKTGKAFSEYLIEVRMEKALQLMKNTEKSISKISEEVGYNNRRYFNKVFEEYTSVTPKEYRGNLRADSRKG